MPDLPGIDLSKLSPMPTEARRAMLYPYRVLVTAENGCVQAEFENEYDAHFYVTFRKAAAAEAMGVRLIPMINGYGVMWTHNEVLWHENKPIEAVLSVDALALAYDILTARGAKE